MVVDEREAVGRPRVEHLQDSTVVGPDAATPPRTDPTTKDAEMELGPWSCGSRAPCVARRWPVGSGSIATNPWTPITRRAPVAAIAVCHAGTPEAARRSMQGWMAWVGELQAGGHLKDTGRPLDPRGSIVRGKRNRMVTDGPFTESKELIAGYTLIEVRSHDEALAWAQRFPAPFPGLPCCIEVRPGRGQLVCPDTVQVRR